MKLPTSLTGGLALAAVNLCLVTRADMVTDWSSNLDLTIEAVAQPVPIQARSIAIVHTAIYDAVNGIVGKYTPYFVTESAPMLARPEAAAIGAAYTTMLSLYPTRKPALDAMQAESLSSLSIDTNAPAITNGLAWGQHVANLILAWRNNDGFSASPTPYFGGGAAGVWRSPPSGTNADGTLAAVFPQLATLTPFAMTNSSQFRPGPPAALTSAQYATDFNEVKLMGRIDSTNRTSEETQLALLWQAVGPVDENRIARALVPSTNALVDNARLFALVNIAAADAIIAGFDSKYTYNFWRPYHAIHLADTNSNPGTVPDPAWNSLFLPPRFQEYMSNHASVTSAFMTILASLLGDTNTFTLAAPGYASFTWSFNKFSDAIAQVKEARIWAGIHFRNSCNVGQTQGTALANYVATNFLLPAPRPSSAVMDPSSTYEGKTYAQWSSSWWQWFYSLPTDRHPLFDTADVSAGQSGNVWFLGGAYTQAATNGVKYGTAARDVVIPQGTALFFPLFAAESATLEGKGTNAAGLQANSQAVIDTVTMLSCAIDGRTVSNLSAYRASSALFTWGPLPKNNVLGDPVNFPAGATSPSVADGYYLLLQPMTPGDHSIHFNGGTPCSQIDITYNITITPTNGVYPPGSTMFGKTYSEWSGAFFQYYFSLPATNNPFHYDSAHPHVPLGTGQNGPVWFVHGYRNLTGTFSRNDTIPGGTSLLLVPVDLFADNTACPNPINDTPAELLSTFVTSYVNGATNMTMKVDGVDVAEISDVLTTPFRVQTIYDYTAPAFDNMIDIDENEPCYQNNQGRPYTVTGAVGDGVVLMIPPLSPGSHTITYQLTLSTASPVYHWNMTENITVQPIMPALDVSHHDGILSLTWPQSAVNYTVEMTSSLNPPNWQPANLPVGALAGIYQVTVPTRTGSQYFRLRPH